MVDEARQAGVCVVEITPAMIRAARNVLYRSGMVDEWMQAPGADALVIKEMLYAALRDVSFQRKSLDQSLGSQTSCL